MFVTWDRMHMCNHLILKLPFEISSQLVELAFRASSLNCLICYPRILCICLLIAISSMNLLQTVAWLFFCISSFDMTMILIIVHPLQNTYLKPSLLIIFVKVWFDIRWLVQFDAPSYCFMAPISSWCYIIGM